jgi:hypothetical protein
MDPRLSWYQPELMHQAHELWAKIWVITQLDSLKSSAASMNKQQQQQLEDECLLKYMESLKKKQQPDNCQNGAPHSVNDTIWRTVKRNKASTFGFNLPNNDYLMLNNNKMTTPWLDLNFNLTSNDSLRLIDIDSDNHFGVCNPARYLLAFDQDVAVIELDKGFLR